MNYHEALGLYTELKEAADAARYRRAAFLNNLGVMARQAQESPERSFDYAEARALLEGAERADAERAGLETRLQEAARVCGKRI
ncbi:MAG TPA: hypothetical protein VN436_13610 [Holophaga sp.]|nr:hypothetical protein [Holophaga sp.]